MNDILITIKQHIAQANNILLVTHDFPDADAVSSIGAMMEYLQHKNKQYVAYCHHLPQKSLLFLPHAREIISDRNWDFNQFDTIISLDCGSVQRTFLEQEIINRKYNQTYIEFDHHIKIDDWADLEARNPSAVSTTEVLYDFFKINNIKINPALASCILTGIIGDSGSFIYPATSQRTIRIASEMLNQGALFSKINYHVWKNKSLFSLKLWGIVLSRLRINAQTKIAFTVLTPDDFQGQEIKEDDLDGLAGFLGNLPDVRAVLFLKEYPRGIIKGSLRTNQKNIDVSKWARLLGGGGHSQAAGFTIKGCLKLVNNRWRIIKK